MSPPKLPFGVKSFEVAISYNLTKYITLYKPKLLGHVLGEISKGSCEQLDCFSEISVSPRDVNSYDTTRTWYCLVYKFLIPSFHAYVECGVFIGKPQ